MAGDPYAAARAAVERFVRDTGGPGGPPSPAAGRRIPRGMLAITIEDDSRERRAGLDRIFDAFDATVVDFPDVLRAALPEIRAAHRDVFATEGSSGRGRWAPLAPSTLVDRRRLGFGPGPIQRRTGALLAHVLGTPAAIAVQGATVTLRIRPPDNVGGVPKYGALARGTSTIPARPMVAVGPAAAARISSSIQRALRARAVANGLG